MDKKNRAPLEARFLIMKLLQSQNFAPNPP